MSNQQGYAWDLAEYRVRQEWHKPLLGKPFVRYGQCLSMAAYFFQMGGVLGGRYRDKLDEFGWAFLGWHGEAGAMSRYFGKVAKPMLPKVAKCSAILDYITWTQGEKLGFEGDVSDLLLEYGMRKVKPETAIQMCWNYAEAGTVLGATEPSEFRRLFEETNKKVDEGSWQFARASGLDIPEQQDVMTYDEVEQEEAESFLDYCQQYAPSLYVPLSSV